MTIVSIGSTHPLNFAGLGIDSRVVSDYGFEHAMVVAGVTAQGRGVEALHAVPAEVVRAQLRVLPDASAYRIGALISAENVREVANFLRERAAPAVVDPVLGASSGEPLYLGSSYIAALRDELLTLPVIVTPNLDEAARLAGFDVETVEQMHLAASFFCAHGAKAALMKGGHLPGDPVDVLATLDRVAVYRGDRLPKTLRGTGCRLAAAFACELAGGSDLFAAAERAREYVRSSIEKDGAR